MQPQRLSDDTIIEDLYDRISQLDAELVKLDELMTRILALLQDAISRDQNLGQALDLLRLEVKNTTSAVSA